MFGAVYLRRLKPVSVLLVAFIALGLVYSVTTPLFEGPDETGHYGYVRYLTDGHGLPVQSFDRAQVIVGEGHQPPLYYAVSALLTFWTDKENEPDVFRPNPLFIWSGVGQDPNVVLHTAVEQFPFQGVSLMMHIARAASVLFGAITVWGTYRLGQIISGRQDIALGAAAVVTLNPQFLFLSGVMNNDNALIAFFTLALVVMVSILLMGRTRARAIWLGVWVGLAFLSKPSALGLGPLILFVMAVTAIRERSWRALGELALWTGLPFLLIAGWWFVRNQILYGDPLGFQMFLASHPPFAAMDFSQADAWRLYWNVMHRSFWGQFGWMVIRLHGSIYDWLAALYLAAAAGALVGYVWRREIGSRYRTQPSLGWIFAILVVLVVAAWTVNYARILGGFGLQGRYLFPAISAIALLIVGGISAVVPDRWRWIPIAGLASGLALLAVRAPSEYIAPAYRFLTLPESALASVPHRLDGTFSPEIALAGYRIESRPEGVRLTLYWRAQGTPSYNYKVFIHALNADDQLCGQHDALPQDGAFLMSSWRAGDVIEDAHTAPIDSDCCVNGACRLKVGLYREDTGERLLYSRNGRPVSDHVEIVPDEIGSSGPGPQQQ